jgi:hypothetical protein
VRFVRNISTHFILSVGENSFQSSIIVDGIPEFDDVEMILGDMDTPTTYSLCFLIIVPQGREPYSREIRHMIHFHPLFDQAPPLLMFGRIPYRPISFFH